MVRRILLVGAGAVGLLVLAGVLVLALFDWNRARDWIGREVTARTGREFVIAGPLEVHPFSLAPRLHAERVRFANAPWAGTQPLLEADRVDVSVALWPLLRGRVVIPDLSLGHARVLLVRDAEGRRNWTLGDPESPGRLPVVQRVTVEDGLLEFQDALTRSAITARLQSTGKRPYAVRVEAQGRVRGVPLKATGGLGALARLAEDGVPFPVRLEGRFGDLRATIDGTFAGLAGHVDAMAVLSGEDLGRAGEPFDVALPRTGPWQISGRLERDGDTWHLQRFRATVGRSNLSGDLALALGGDRPRLTGTARSSLLDLADLGGMVGAGPGLAKRNPPGRILPHAAIPAAQLRRLDVDLRIGATRLLQGERWPLEQLDAHLTLQDGVLRADPLVFGVAGGQARLVAQLDARRATPEAALQATFQGLKLSRLMPGKGRLDEALGGLDGKLQLAGAGASPAALLGHADGRIDLFSPGGKVSNLALEVAGADIAEALKFFVGGDRKVRLNCAVASFDVKAGLARSNVIVIDTDDTLISGAGTMSLRDETLDLTLTPLPKDASIATLRGPLKVAGTFKAPRVGLEKKALARKAGAAALLALINPLAALLPLVDPGGGEDAPCGKLVAQAKEATRR